MESPFRSEAAAFRFLLITIGAFALIVLASWISTLLGFLTFLALSAAAVAIYLRQRGPAPERQQVEHARRPRRAPRARRRERDGRRRGAPEHDQHARARREDAVPRRLPGAELAPQDVHVGRGSGPRGGAGSGSTRRSRGSRRSGSRRRARSATATRSSRSTTPCGRSARTRSSSRRIPPGRSNWLERGVVESVRARYDVPVTHVVVDLEATDERRSPAEVSQAYLPAAPAT